jgi:uncharacterized protein (DUF2252 family)
MARPDPIELGVRQFQRDRARHVAIGGLMERKTAKMVASPLAFLRGSAPLFYEVLVEHPELAEGPDDRGYLCGDAHVENFGVYRTSRAKTKAAASDTLEGAAVVFDVNDFDEAVVGPWKLDVLRLLSSLILAGRGFVADGKQTIALSRALIGSYVGSAFLGAALPSVPAPVGNLLAKVERRSIRDVLERRTVLSGGQRRFMIGERYLVLPKELEEPAREAFATYMSAFPEHELPRDRCQIVDMAFRVAGTGSLGSVRVAVLTRGKGGADGAWLFDMKEEGRPAAEPLLGLPELEPAERVVAGARACLEAPPRMMGTTRLAGVPMFVRRLAPQEDKLDLTRIAKGELLGLSSYLGALMGRAHRHGAKSAGKDAWSQDEQEALIERAITLAGVHEAAYLAFCKCAIGRSAG